VIRLTAATAQPWQDAFRQGKLGSRAMDNTMTELDLDATSQPFVESLRSERSDFDPDLAVDGLSDSLLSRLFRLLTLQKR
jgi:hypothetical protein